MFVITISWHVAISKLKKFGTSGDEMVSGAGAALTTFV